jgi:hypothetical protein
MQFDKQTVDKKEFFPLINSGKTVETAEIAMLGIYGNR